MPFLEGKEVLPVPEEVTPEAVVTGVYQILDPLGVHPEIRCELEDLIDAPHPETTDDPIEVLGHQIRIAELLNADYLR